MKEETRFLIIDTIHQELKKIKEKEYYRDIWHTELNGEPLLYDRYKYLKHRLKRLQNTKEMK